MKLGRKAIKTDSRTLRLARYFAATPPPPPSARDWTKGITQFGMLKNDILGDCTCAAVGHAVQIFTANASTEASIGDHAVVVAYEDWCGYRPSDPNTDQGGFCLDVLKDWKRSTFNGHRLNAFATVTLTNTVEVKQAINVFGGVYIGLNLPLSAQAQVGGVWDVVQDDGTGNTVPGSWGGHCIFTPTYDPSTNLTSITWGTLQTMTLAFWLKYVDEVYCLISKDFIETSGVDPSGFHMAQLEADLAAINQ
jgi:hypothetical protein